MGIYQIGVQLLEGGGLCLIYLLYLDPTGRLTRNSLRRYYTKRFAKYSSQISLGLKTILVDFGSKFNSEHDFFPCPQLWDFVPGTEGHY